MMRRVSCDDGTSKELKAFADEPSDKNMATFYKDCGHKCRTAAAYAGGTFNSLCNDDDIELALRTMLSEALHTGAPSDVLRPETSASCLSSKVS